MSKRKIFELAEEFKMSCAAMVRLLKSKGIPVKDHMSIVGDEVKEIICNSTKNFIKTKRSNKIMENKLEIKFLGAVGTVTGSCTALKFTQASGGAHYYLVDIGEYQGESMNADCRLGRDWLVRNAKRIEGIFITHAHYDHVGFLPEFVMKHGFTGTIYCSTPTKELMYAILADSLHISNAPYKVSEVFEKVKFCPMDNFKKGRFYTLCPDLRVSTLNSGHVLGSNIFQFTWKRDPDPENAVWENLYFSGDIGPNTEAEYSNILLKEFQYPFYKSDNPSQTVNIVLESTYGNRTRENKADLYERKLEKLEEIVTDAVTNDRTVIFPAFALNRAQEVLLDLHYLKAIRKTCYDVCARKENLSRINKKKILEHCFVKRDGNGNVIENMAEMRDEFRDSCYDLHNIDIECDMHKKLSDIPQHIKNLLCDMLNRHKPFKESVFPIAADSRLMENVNGTYKKYLLQTFPKKDETLGFEYLSKSLFKWFGVSDLGDLDKLVYARNLTDRFLNVKSSSSSKGKTENTGGCRLIVGSSGMCDEGAILESLKKYLPDENAVVVITGYQAKDTNGYHLKNMHTYSEQKKVGIRLRNINMQLAEVKCKVVDLSEYYSGHADQDTLVRFVTGGDECKNNFQTRVFLNHGQDDSRTALKERLERNDNIKVTIPDDLGWHNLNTGEVSRDDEPVATETERETPPKDCGDIKGINVGDITVLIPEYYGEVTIKRIKACLKALVDDEMRCVA